MATAICGNDQCERDEWQLTKRPEDYKRGPNCPDCGTTKVEVVDAEPAQQQAERLPAQAQEQQQGGMPATAGQLPDDQGALAMGAQGAAILSSLDSPDPQERSVAYGRGLKAVGSLLAQYGDEVEQTKAQQAQRAKNAQDEDLKVAEDYPSCPECGTQIYNIPEGQEFPCPGCGTRLEYT